MARPKKQETKASKLQNEGSASWAGCSQNRDVARKYIVDDADGNKQITGIDPLVRVENFDRFITRLGRESDRKRISLEEYTHLIYAWLMLNPKMLDISDYYEFPESNAPFIYTLDEVIEFDSDEIYNLLQSRLTKMMLRRQIDRESALAVLREKYGWQRDNEQNINLNTNAKVSFKFGDQNLNQPQLETDNDKKE